MRRCAFLLVWLAGCEADPAARAFRDEVAPTLERTCLASTCHGVAPGDEAAGDVVDWDQFFFAVDADGRIVDLDEARAHARRFVVTEEDAGLSTLLRKPLAAAWGGLPHAGGVSFPSPEDAAYAGIRAWIALEAGGGEDVAPLDAAEARFADTIQPALVGMTCMNASCHGPQAAVPFRLDGGVGGVIGTAATRANYEAVLRMLALDGDVERSRILRKALPLADGGILHKGGNVGFLTGRDDPRATAIVAFACAEQAARVGIRCGEDPLEGFVFVRGPVGPQDPFDLDVYASGTDIWLARTAGDPLRVVGTENLTAALHDGSGDARDPAIDPTGTRLAFVLRASSSAGHDLYTMDLGTREVRRLTADAGPLPGGGVRTWRDPTWAPDGRVWAVGTAAGAVADQGRLLDADLYEIDPDGGAPERRTWTPHIERKPVFFVVGEEAGGEIAFTALRDALPGQARAHPFRFPPGVETEYHQHFGITPPEDLFSDMRELPDGRYVVVVGALGAAWEGGGLGVVDRNFGPEAPEGATGALSLPFYADPLTRLADGGGLGAPVLYRDPAGLGDGRILAAAAESVDRDDPAASVDFAVVVLGLSDGPDGPRLASRRVLVDAPGVSDYDPEPIAVRRAARATPLRWDADAETGTLLHQGLPMVEAILGNLAPTGVKPVRDDIRAVRLVEAIPTTPAERSPLSVGETRASAPGATTSALGVHGPARILAELPVEADGTFTVELPAGVAFRIQALDADGMAVPPFHNRWFDLHPGQVLKQGIGAPALSGAYTARCAACHGAADGDPDAVFGPVDPDVIASASFSLARYEGRNPRRPVDPPLAGEDTRLEVDFVRDVEPVLVRACAGCHAGDPAPAGLSLTDAPTAWFDDAYESLLAPGTGSGGGRAWVDDADGSARASALVEVLRGVELDAPWVLARPGSAHPADVGVEGLTDAELLTIERWIDLGATWVGTGGAP